MSRSVFTFATASSSGIRPFNGTSADAVVINRPLIFLTCGSRRNRSWSTPTATTPILSAGTPICAVMSRLDEVDTVTRRGSWRRHALLHAEELVPALERDPAIRILGVRQVKVAVNGDRVVQRGQQRPAVLDHAEQPRPEALVVMDDVEVADAILEHPADAMAPRARFGEPAAGHDQQFFEVDERLDLPRPRDPERVRLAVQVEGGHGGELHAVVEHRIRRTAEDLDFMAEFDQRLGEIAGVDPLAARIRVAAVDQKGNAEAGAHEIDRLQGGLD